MLLKESSHETTKKSEEINKQYMNCEAINEIIHL